MTATPERTDGADIFKIFNYQIAYEIRLHRALEEKMLSPFHYLCQIFQLMEKRLMTKQSLIS